MVFWAMSLSYSPFLLLFLNRAVRSIGPALLAMMLVAVVGATLAAVAASTPRGMSAVVHALMAVHLPSQWMLPAVLLAGMLASVPLAWWVARRLRAAYAARWLTDQSLMIDALWLFQAVLLSFSLTQSIGPIHMIGAPDLASSTIGPDEFLDFLAGRLCERFILEPAAVPERLAALDERCDIDARRRVTGVFCGDDTWRAAARKAGLNLTPGRSLRRCPHE